MAILELKDIKYAYNEKKQVINGASCAFEEGTVYALVGRSGAGKSTLLSLMAGLDVPDGGEVLFNGRATGEMDLTDYRLRSVAVIYQDFELFPLLTVLENIMYPMQLNGIPEKDALAEAKRLAAKVALAEELYDRYPSELSGGEQQRVAIARGLTMDGRIMLADEPTGNLDSENSDNIFRLLAELAHKDGRCIIIVTHDLTIMDKADVVCQIVDGKIVRR